MSNHHAENTLQVRASVRRRQPDCLYQGQRQDTARLPNLPESPSRESPSQATLSLQSKVAASLRNPSQHVVLEYVQFARPTAPNEPGTQRPSAVTAAVHGYSVAARTRAARDRRRRAPWTSAGGEEQARHSRARLESGGPSSLHGCAAAPLLTRMLGRAQVPAA